MTRSLVNRFDRNAGNFTDYRESRPSLESFFITWIILIHHLATESITKPIFMLTTTLQNLGIQVLVEEKLINFQNCDSVNIMSTYNDVTIFSYDYHSTSSSCSHLLLFYGTEYNWAVSGTTDDRESRQLKHSWHQVVFQAGKKNKQNTSKNTWWNNSGNWKNHERWINCSNNHKLHAVHTDRIRWWVTFSFKEFLQIDADV